MQIRMGEAGDTEVVKNIVYTTINEIYPRYYPNGAVEFFIKYHNNENIRKDIENGLVFLVHEDQKVVGTVTIKENEIYRLFVMPQYQGNGYGKCMIEFAENRIFEKYDYVKLDASFPAESMYLKRGYKEVNYKKLVTDSGDYLCYNIMKKEKKEVTEPEYKLRINSIEDSIHVIKENGTEVNYFLFPEYEIHLNKIRPNSIQEYHYHSNIEEVIVVTRGVLTCRWIDGDKEHVKDVHKDEVVQVKKSIHTFENNTSEEVLFIVFRLVLDGNDKRELIKNDKTVIR